MNMEGEQGDNSIIHFTIQVKNRPHLARIMRAVRHIPDVIRIVRERSTDKR